ncbi:hypothetical protein PRK78_006056 [Emydomyces testavorans]|uniref:Uncharacterized protein n=1 Tax=Emydomyces testavorans TaxID=2070801 RepID=A0AAF0IN80_9EURO|nr:hypothetical protein PRK78_006056 [Emydomyces testavorans]
MEPTLLVMLFAGLTIFSSWFSVPLTTLNPQRPVAERLVGSFQLTAAVQGVSTIYCRFNQPGNEFLGLFNHTLLSSVPIREETRGERVSKTASFEQAATATPTATATTSIIPTPTVPFGGAEHIVYDAFFDNGSAYPEWFIARLVSLAGEHVRQHPNVYTVATGFVLVQVLTMTYLARQIQKLVQGNRQQNRANADIDNLEDFLANFKSLERRFNDLSATVNAWPQQLSELVGDGSVQIRTLVDRLGTQFEKLQRQVNDLANASEKSQDNGMATQIEALAAVVEDLKQKMSAPQSDALDADFLKSLQTQVKELAASMEQLKHGSRARSESASSQLESLAALVEKLETSAAEDRKRLNSQIDSLTSEISQLRAEGAELRMKPWESATEVTANELQTLRSLLADQNSAAKSALDNLSRRIGAVEARWEEKPWELSQSEKAVMALGLNERLDKLDPEVKNLQQDLNKWKEFTVMNSELAHVEANVKMIKQKLDSEPWAQVLTKVDNQVESLSKELKKLAGEVGLVDQSVNQLKAEQPWKRDSSLTGSQLAAINDFLGLKETLASKQETKALSETIRRTEETLATCISKTWPADLSKLEQLSREMERSLRSEIDSFRHTFNTDSDLKIRDKQINSLNADVNELTTKVKELAARPVSVSSQGAVTAEELRKVKEMAREADNSAISCELAVNNMRDRIAGAERELEGTSNILKYHEFDIQSCTAKLGIQRAKVNFDGAPKPSGQAPASNLPAQSEAKPDKPAISSSDLKKKNPSAKQATPAAKDTESKSESKREEPKDVTSDKKGEQPSTASTPREPAKLQRETESTSKPSEASTSVEPTPPGLEASIWATAGPPEPKPAGLEASRWAPVTSDPKPAGLEASRWATVAEPDPKPAGLEASRWATPDPTSSAGSGQKKGNSKKGKQKAKALRRIFSDPSLTIYQTCRLPTLIS